MRWRRMERSKGRKMGKEGKLGRDEGRWEEPGWRGRGEKIVVENRKMWIEGKAMDMNRRKKWGEEDTEAVRGKEKKKRRNRRKREKEDRTLTFFFYTNFGNLTNCNLVYHNMYNNKQQIVDSFKKNNTKLEI